MRRKSTGATSVVACSATLAAVLLLGACGQKGPLTLPPITTPSAPAGAASEAAR